MRATWGVMTALLVSAGGCSTGGIGDILGGVLGGGAGPGTGTGSSSIVAEVQNVDPRSELIQVRTEDGQRVDVRYDRETRVVYRQQEYEVGALERGDVVRMSLARNGNQYWTNQIEVQQSVQDRQGGMGSGGSLGDDDDRLYQLSGTVDQVDGNRGTFTMRTSNGDWLTVALPYNATSTIRSRFQQLRRGNTVRVEGRFISEERMELARFL